MKSVTTEVPTRSSLSALVRRPLLSWTPISPVAFAAAAFAAAVVNARAVVVSASRAAEQEEGLSAVLVVVPSSSCEVDSQSSPFPPATLSLASPVVVD